MDAYTANSGNQRAGVISALPSNESRASGVSWAAVIAGAFVGAALSVTLLALGMGLGFSAMSPWSNAGASAGAIGAATVIWLIVMHAIASALSGYMAGRLRTKWVDVHTDEVFFRDTAHGFLAWAVGLVIGAAFLTSAAASLIGAATETVAQPLSTAAGEAVRPTASSAGDDRSSYFVDMLMRGKQSAAGGATEADTRAEVGRIFASGIKQGNLSAGDKTYVAGLIAARTGASQADAEGRVDDVMAQVKKAETEAKQAADTARKAASKLSLWTFLSFLVGAFCASYAATIGGRQRDHAVVA